MYIRTDNDNNIVEVIFVGQKPQTNGFEVDKNEIEEDVLKNILSYKYVNGEFILNERDVLVENIEKIRSMKIQFLSDCCSQSIISGIDFEGEHYSLNQYDQMEIARIKEELLSDSSMQEVYYHADGKKSKTYSKEDFLTLEKATSNWISLNRLYFNFLKHEILNIKEAKELIPVFYGQSLLLEDADILTSEFSEELCEKIPVIEDRQDYESMFKIPQIDINSIQEVPNLNELLESLS